MIKIFIVIILIFVTSPIFSAEKINPLKSFSLSDIQNFEISTPNFKETERFDNLIDVGAPGRKKIRMAVPLFSAEGITKEISSTEIQNLNSRIKDILGFTNWFFFIPNDAFVSTPNVTASQFVPEHWSIIKTDYVIFGKIKPTDNNLFNLELRLFDVKAKTMLVGKIYTNLNLKVADIALKRFGDILIEKLTGTPGPFMSHIAFVGRTSLKSKSSDIYICDFDGSNIIQITNNHSINLSPAWSPDGTKIAYTSFYSGKPEIYQYDLTTKKTTQLTSDTSNSSGANWNNTGDTIAFSSTTEKGETQIYSMASDGRNKSLLIGDSEIEVEPSYAPNGEYLAYTSNKFGKPMIFVLNTKTNKTTRLTYAGWYNASATWDSDSKIIAFASYDREIDRWDLFKINSDKTNLERLTLKEGDNEKPSFSPDGRFIAFQSNRGVKNINTIEGNHKLYVLSKDGSYQRKLNISIYDARQPVWGPRLDKIYY